jgi:hypothetical protein
MPAVLCDHPRSPREEAGPLKGSPVSVRLRPGVPDLWRSAGFAQRVQMSRPHSVVLPETICPPAYSPTLRALILERPGPAPTRPKRPHLVRICVYCDSEVAQRPRGTPVKMHVQFNVQPHSSCPCTALVHASSLSHAPSLSMATSRSCAPPPMHCLA